MAQKRRRNKKSKKIISLVLFLILFVAACVVVYFVWNTYFKEDKKDDDTVIVESTDKKEEKDESKKEEKPEEEIVEKEEIKPYEGNNPNTAEDLTGVITYAGVSGNNLMIRVNIDQYLDNGSCALSLVAGGASIYNDTANIVSSASTATCEGFNVPLSSIGSGNYQIIIKLNSGGKTGTIQGEANI